MILSFPLSYLWKITTDMSLQRILTRSFQTTWPQKLVFWIVFSPFLTLLMNISVYIAARCFFHAVTAMAFRSIRGLANLLKEPMKSIWGDLQLFQWLPITFPLRSMQGLKGTCHYVCFSSPSPQLCRALTLLKFSGQTFSTEESWKKYISKV